MYFYFLFFIFLIIINYAISAKTVRQTGGGGVLKRFALNVFVTILYYYNIYAFGPVIIYRERNARLGLTALQHPPTGVCSIL